MGKESSMIKRYASITRRGVVLALAVSAVASVAHAGPSPHMRSGLVGLARLQTARLSAVRYQPALRGELPPVPIACTVTLAFHRADGTPYLTRAGQSVQREVGLMPDGAAALDLRASDVFIDNPNIREAFSASVRMVVPDVGDIPPNDGDVSAGPCRNVVVTLDVFDNISGRTSLFLAHSDFIDNPDLIDNPNLTLTGTPR
jgi:hypothetical protein